MYTGIAHHTHQLHTLWNDCDSAMTDTATTQLRRPTSHLINLALLPTIATVGAREATLMTTNMSLTMTTVSAKIGSTSCSWMRSRKRSRSETRSEILGYVLAKDLRTQRHALIVVIYRTEPEIC